MNLPLDQEQTDVLREMLQADLRNLRIETARTDSPGYRAMLHRREAIVESLLDKLAAPSHPDLS